MPISAVVLYSGHVRHPDAKTVLINRETVFLNCIFGEDDTDRM